MGQPGDSPSDGFEALRELALNLRSVWNHRTDSLWERIDSVLWRETGNPWIVLQTASRARLRELWETHDFRSQVETLIERRRRALSEPRWFQREHAKSGVTSIAFFSMEYALSETLPMYSGGLGNVAGDYLKAASDLGVPLVGVGLLYEHGYFRQTIDATGSQRESFPINAATQLPLVPVRDADGAWMRVRLPRPGPPVWLRGWEARVGRVPLYLLDSNDPSNMPADRGITAQLYGGGEEIRLLQEMALGIGGWRLLRALGLQPEICHLNEGHAALLVLERARDFMRETGHSFDVALAATRAGNLFTTHTPVEAGFDRFAPDLAQAYLGAYAGEELGIPFEQLLGMGRSPSATAREPLNMAWLAARGSGAINAVSDRHEKVSRRIFQVLFQRWPEAEVPVGHVTNGVHVPSWDSSDADSLWTAACGEDRWVGQPEDLGRRISAVPDVDLWSFRSRARTAFVSFVRERLVNQLAASGVTDGALYAAGQVLDADALTLGFAKRFTEYKRPTLLLRDRERLARLLNDPQRRVQIVVAGKAHPRDEEGKAMIADWVQFARRADVRKNVVFLADYDLRLAERLVQGVDVWINTPRPPWEACGTSGMKVLVNGGLNLSSLDGWWSEAYRPEVGWAIPGDGASDQADATHLYELLERELIPAFYDRDVAGVPKRWVARMRASMASLTPVFSASRALREYAERYYLPAASEFGARRVDGAKGGVLLAEWERTMRQHWPALHFGDIEVRTEGGWHIFSVALYLDDADPDSVAVELYADGSGNSSTRVTMRRASPLVGAHGFTFTADVPDTRSAADYTPRAMPTRRGLNVPQEVELITWARS
ncbi:MAG: alpha-glucan family phosphorylase [Polyangiaceae bacterium]